MLLAVIVLLAILMALSATWIRRAVHERQQLDRREIEIQATRLAESGLARARARLARDANYTGELWEIAPDAWHAGRAARVQIDAKPIDRDVQQIQITAKAVYPYEDARAVQRTRTLLVERPTVQPSKQ